MYPRASVLSRNKTLDPASRFCPLLLLFFVLSGGVVSLVQQYMVLLRFYGMYNVKARGRVGGRYQLAKDSSILVGLHLPVKKLSPRVCMSIL